MLSYTSNRPQIDLKIISIITCPSTVPLYGSRAGGEKLPLPSDFAVVVNPSRKGPKYPNVSVSMASVPGIVILGYGMYCILGYSENFDISAKMRCVWNGVELCVYALVYLHIRASIVIRYCLPQFV